MVFLTRTEVDAAPPEMGLSVPVPPWTPSNLRAAMPLAAVSGSVMELVHVPVTWPRLAARRSVLEVSGNAPGGAIHRRDAAAGGRALPEIAHVERPRSLPVEGRGARDPGHAEG